MATTDNIGTERLRAVYREGVFEGEPPEYPVQFDAVREAAWEAMDEKGRAYVHGGAGSESTFERGQNFSAWRIVPRMLQDVANRSLSVELLGETFDWPIGFTPLGVQSLLHESAEVGTARAAERLNVPMALSSLSSRSMETVADTLGDTPKWFQLYWSSDDAITASFLDRAEQAGYDAIVVTVDAPTLGWRERLIERGYTPFLDGDGLGNYYSDPAFLDRLDDDPDDDPRAAAEEFQRVFGKPSLTWDDLSFVTERTELPMIVKGVLHPEDARRAVEAGADAVQVSTHGGRQVDGSITALEALPGIVDAVGDETAVLFDSGIRRGHHALIALALGADFCLLGRPFAYGLAMGGAEGVAHVTTNLLAELDLTMGLAGHDDVTALDRSCLRHEQTLPTH